MSLVTIVKKGIASLSVAAALTLSTPDPAEAQQRIFPGGVVSDIDPNSRFAVMAVNIFGQGLICGVASAAGGHDVRRVFHDAAQCMLGGTIQYIGMELGIQDVPILPGFAMRVIETGTSIIDNTLAGREMLERLHYELGPLMIEIDTRRGEIDAFWRIYPVAGIIYNVAGGHDLDPIESLSTQIITFRANAGPIPGLNYNGETTGNIVRLNYGAGPRLQGHERMHVYQYIRFRPFQNIFPDALDFFEETLHLRLGEDLLFGLITLPQTICRATDTSYCGRQVYDLGEIEAYTMDSALKER